MVLKWWWGQDCAWFGGPQRGCLIIMVLKAESAAAWRINMGMIPKTQRMTTRIFKWETQMQLMIRLHWINFLNFLNFFFFWSDTFLSDIVNRAESTRKAGRAWRMACWLRWDEKKKKILFTFQKAKAIFQRNFSLRLLFEALRIEAHVDESQRTDENITHTHVDEAPGLKVTDYFTITIDISCMESLHIKGNFYSHIFQLANDYLPLRKQNSVLLLRVLM